MEFDAEHYPTIREACRRHETVEFWIDINATAFANSDGPETWTEYPPCLPPEAYGLVFAYAGIDKPGALITLALIVHLDGGKILYRARNGTSVSVKVTWPGIS